VSADKFRVIEFPNSQRTFFHKIYYEYVAFKKLSKVINPYLWFSLNDCSPTVVSNIQCVYFHNATPFYKITWMDLKFPSRVLFQKFYYNFFYRINLHKNKNIIVQQGFLKSYVARKFGVDLNKILINRPEFTPPFVNASSTFVISNEVVTFFYPTKAFAYKNIHVIVEALRILKSNHASASFSVVLTLEGTENRYSRWLKEIASVHREVKFVGYLSFDLLTEHYQNSDCLLFPSKLETWGLPLSEARHFNKYILAADLPYAHETLMGYEDVRYFNPDSPLDLANLMTEYMSSFKSSNRDIAKIRGEGNSQDKSLKELFNTILSNG
jgi:glycosyltransferase involved in cell wall biosynthesis